MSACVAGNGLFAVRRIAHSVAAAVFVWEAGTTVPNNGGSYGSLGVPVCASVCVCPCTVFVYLIDSQASTNTPGARYFHSMVMDTVGSRLLVFGGNGYSGSACCFAVLSRFFKLNHDVSQLRSRG